jgi:hypothetical protein
MNEEEFEIVERMGKFGGSFVQSLAGCFYRADRNNIERLKKAFPEYWLEYKNLTKNQDEI